MSLRLVLIGPAVSAVVPLAHAQLITHRDLSYGIAKTIAETDDRQLQGQRSPRLRRRRGSRRRGHRMRADNAGAHTFWGAHPICG
jgi:hypothetical protein